MNQEKAELLASLRDATSIDSLFPKAACFMVACFLLIHLGIYVAYPSDTRAPLNQDEQSLCFNAGIVMFVAILANLLRPQLLQSGRAPSGIVLAGVLVSTLAMVTNLLLAFYPTIVLVDKVTKSRVFLWRWAEWIAAG